MNANFGDMQDTQLRITQLQTNLQLLKQRVEERKKLLLETLAFYKNNKRVSGLVDVPTCNGESSVQTLKAGFHW